MLTVAGSKTFDAGKWVVAWGHLIGSLSKGIDQFDKLRQEVRVELETPFKKRRLASELGAISWAELYELPFAPQIVYSAASILPLRDVFFTLMPWNVPKSLAVISAGQPLESDYDPPRSAIPRIARHAWAMQGQMRALLICQRSMSDLIASARRDDDDLFLAVRIDPAVLGGKTAQRRIHRATALNQPEFFTRLATALRTPIEVESEYSRLDTFLALLAKAKQIHVLTPDIASELFIKRTGLYTRHGKQDAKASLWRLILRWKKKHATLLG